AFLSRLNEPEDPRRDLVYEMIAITSDAMYFARPRILARVCRYGMERLLRDGVSQRCRGSAVDVVTLVGLTFSGIGKIGLAIELGKATRRLLDSIPLETKGRVLFSAVYFLLHLEEPLRKAAPLFLTAATYSQQARDTTYEA